MKFFKKLFAMFLAILTLFSASSVLPNVNAMFGPARGVELLNCFMKPKSVRSDLWEKLFGKARTARKVTFNGKTVCLPYLRAANGKIKFKNFAYDMTEEERRDLLEALKKHQDDTDLSNWELYTPATGVKVEEEYKEFDRYIQDIKECVRCLDEFLSNKETGCGSFRQEAVRPKFEAGASAACDSSEPKAFSPAWLVHTGDAACDSSEPKAFSSKHPVIIPKALHVKEWGIAFWGKLAGKDRCLRDVEIKGHVYSVPNYKYADVSDFTDDDFNHFLEIESCFTFTDIIYEFNKLESWDVLTEEEMKQFGEVKKIDNRPCGVDCSGCYFRGCTSRIRRWAADRKNTAQVPVVTPEVPGEQKPVEDKKTTFGSKEQNFGATHTSGNVFPYVPSPKPKAFSPAWLVHVSYVPSRRAYERGEEKSSSSLEVAHSKSQAGASAACDSSKPKAFSLKNPVIIPKALHVKEWGIAFWGKLAGKDRCLRDVEIEGHVYSVPNYKYADVSDFTDGDFYHFLEIESCFTFTDFIYEFNKLKQWDVLTEEEMKQFGEVKKIDNRPCGVDCSGCYFQNCTSRIRRWAADRKNTAQVPVVTPEVPGEQKPVEDKKTTFGSKEQNFGATHTSGNVFPYVPSPEPKAFSSSAQNPYGDARLKAGNYCYTHGPLRPFQSIGYRINRDVKCLEPGIKTSVTHYISDIFNESIESKKGWKSLKTGLYYPFRLDNQGGRTLEAFYRKEIEELHPKALEILKNYYQNAMIEGEDPALLERMKWLPWEELTGYSNPWRMSDYICSLYYQFEDELKKRYNDLWKEVRDAIYEMPEERIVCIDEPLKEHDPHNREQDAFYNGAKIGGVVLSGSYIMPAVLSGPNDNIWYKLYGQKTKAALCVDFNGEGHYVVPHNYYLPYLTSVVETPEGTVVKNKFADGFDYGFTRQELTILYNIFKDYEKYRDIKNWVGISFNAWNVACDHNNSGKVTEEEYVYVAARARGRSVPEANTSKTLTIDQYIEDMKEAAECIRRILGL